MVLSPKETGRLILENCKFVTIKQEGIEKLGNVLVEEFTSGSLQPANFSQVEFHPKPDDLHVLDWLFVVDTLNFCFWNYDDAEGWKVEGYTGYFALCATINRALKEKVDILNPKFYSTISEEQLKKIFRSDTKVEIPLLAERLKCLHEVGAVLQENFESSFDNVVKKAQNSAKSLLNLIISNFKCFQDEALFESKQVSFYKRAQILVGDVWACFKGEGTGYFKDIDEITMFADYRIPQTLLWYGVFEYNNELLKKLESNAVLKNGDREELEIRACSIHAVELLKDYANKRLETKKINSILIDHFLWDFRRKHVTEIDEKGLPFHKVLCIYY
ncbi:LOW QUALITY PROTEIN: queuosine salvage protein-like [Sitophilus oryzae]|uniref:Queuosine 5'-phosphate N-glycosylase/hydrolase n=1 Tax=Sitophilus oryzae TaxID=7048 RepID=A0A6J2XQS0_SITOR|nr:LOW QUALITY PROTEIN: queuosine salvage protein-like [Sitophilus oryzae]